MICLIVGAAFMLLRVTVLSQAAALSTEMLTTKPLSPYLLKSEIIHPARMIADLNRQSVAFDNQGHPHIVYGKDGLYHAWYDGSQWQGETLDTNNGWEDTHAAIAIQGSNIHVAYQKNARLYYAHWNGALWQTENLEVDRYGTYPSIAVEPHSPYTVHIAYGSADGAVPPQFIVRHVWHDGMGWQGETVDDTASARDIMLKIAPTTPFTLNVAYVDDYDSNYPLLKYAWHDAQGWYSETAVSDCCRNYVHIAFALSPAAPHTPYVGYTNPPDGSPHLLQRTPTGWQSIPGPTPFGSVYDLHGMEFEPTAPYTLHVVYDTSVITFGGVTEAFIRHSWGNGSEWQSETIGPSQSNDGVLALEPAAPYTPNLVHVGNFDLLYAHRSTSTWSDTIVDWRGPAGAFNSLAIAPTAPFTPHVAYVYHGDLYHALRSGENWISETVDAVGLLESVGKYGRHVALALAHGVPFTPSVAYYDAGADQLKYAFLGESGWQTQTVAAGGWYPALALEPTAPFTPHISYIDRGSSLVAHAWLNGNSWLTETVDAGAQAGGNSTAIAIAVGEPYTLQLAYFDQEHDTVNYARRTATEWVTQTVDHSPFTDGAAKIALAVEPIAPYASHLGYIWALRPYAIAYNRPPLHALLTAAGWQTETVALPRSAVAAGSDIAFAIEPQAPYRLYLEVVNDNNQALAYKQNNQWQVQQWSVEAYFNAPAYSSLALAPMSPTVPYVTYVSPIAGDLIIWSGAEPSFFAYVPLISRSTP
jgi:hypothetical protein